MRWFHIAVILLCGGLLQVPQRPAQGAETPLTRLRLAGLVARKHIPLTKALAQIGWHTQDGYILFGVEVRLMNGREPAIDLDVPADGTLGTALQHVLRQLPGYRLEIISQHLVEIYPADAKNDPNDALNLRIDNFDVVDKPPDVIMNVPTLFMPALAERLAQRRAGPSPPVQPPSQWAESVGPKLTLHLRNMTVRDILDRVGEASENLYPKYLPLGWVASLRPDPALATGWAYSFRAFPTVPSTWEQQKPKAKNQTLGSTPAR